MIDCNAESTSGTREFFPKHNVGWLAAGAIAAGAFIIVCGLASLVLGLSLPAGKDAMMPGIVGGTAAGAFFTIYYGVSLLKAPLRVRLDQAGLHIVGRLSEQHFPWQRIARISRDKHTQIGGKIYSSLRLFDDSGKRLAEIRDVFHDFDELVAQVQARSSAARGAATYDRDSDRQQKVARQKRNARLLAVMCSLLCVIAGAVIGWGIVELVREKQFASDGAIADARILRRHLRSVTPYVEYSFMDPAGVEHTRDAMVDEPTYEALEGASTVPVRYIRSAPDWNRLVSGETESHPTWMLIIGGSIVLLMFGGGLLMMALGYSDLRFKDGKFVLKRFGDVEDELQPAASAPPLAAATSMVPGIELPPMPPPPAVSGSGMMVLGILNIVIGSLGLVCNGGRMAALLVMSGQDVNLGANAVHVEGSADIYATFTADMLLGALLAVAGIGLLVRRRWGRTMSIVIASLQVVSTIVAVALTIHHFTGLPDDPDVRARAHQLAGQVSAIVGMLVATVYPVVLLILLTRPSLRHWPSNHSIASGSRS